MDPQAAWDQMLAAYAAGEYESAEEFAQSLRDWLGRGGFPPAVLGNPQLGPEFDGAGDRRVRLRAGRSHSTLDDDRISRNRAKGGSMSLTSHIGYGPFHLVEFAPGELFARFDGSLAKVCDPQPAGRPEFIQVWTDFGNSNARKEWLHKTAQAFAISEEQGWSIHRRQRGGCDAC